VLRIRIRKEEGKKEAREREEGFWLVLQFINKPEKVKVRSWVKIFSLKKKYWVSFWSGFRSETDSWMDPDPEPDLKLSFRIRNTAFHIIIIAIYDGFGVGSTVFLF